MLNAFAIFCLGSKRQCLINIYSIFFPLEFIHCYYLQQNYRCFKKETNSVLYPDSLGPRKIRRAVVDLVILVFLCDFISPSPSVPSGGRNFLPFVNDTKFLEINC